jgi:signal-transduction protein with cAMP-binding, CBS, and nucleotidyltransferase domain
MQSTLFEPEVRTHIVYCIQLLMRSETKYYSKGTIIADSREAAKGLIVITSGQV